MTIPLSYAHWGWREHASAMRGLLADRDDPAQVLVQAFRRLGYRDRLMPVNFGRTGLMLALQALQARHPDRRDVAVSAYICSSVVDTVRAAGLDPVPVAVGADLNLDPDDTERCVERGPLAVLAAHLYAAPAAIGRIAAACAAAGVALIDDAAHVVGVEVDGRPLGCHGDVGFLSFNQSKTLTGGSPNGGGLLCAHDDALGQEIERRWRALPPAAFRPVDYTGFVMHFLCDRFDYPPDDYFVRIRQRLGLHHQPVLGQSRISAAAAATVLAQCARLPAILHGKMRVATAYAVALQSVPGVTFPQFAPGRYLSRVLVQLPAGVLADRVQQAMRARGVRTRNAYPPWSDPADPATARAVALSNALIELPGGIGLTETQIETVCSRLRAVLAGA